MIEFKAFASGSKGNLYTVSDGITTLMIECGVSIKDVRRHLNHKVSNIAGALITHEHGDHSKGVRDLIRSGIDCYMTEGTSEALQMRSHRIKTIQAEKRFSIGTWTVLPLEAQHDAAEPVAFLMVNQEGEKVLFATDTYYLKYKFKQLNVIAVECNYSEDILEKNINSGRVPTFMKKRLLRSHFSLHNVKEFLKANDLSKVQEIWLLHLSDSNSDEARFKREIQELTGRLVMVP